MNRCIFRKIIPFIGLGFVFFWVNNAIGAQSPTVMAGLILTVNYQITNNKNPTITGNINSPDAVIYVIANKNTYKGTNNGDGSWAVGISNSLDDGVYDITVAAASDLGAQAVMTVVKSLTIDTVPPKVIIQDLMTNDQSPAIQGTTDDNAAMIVVNINGTNYDMVNNNGDGTWTLPAGAVQPKLVSGSYEMTAAASDLAGNTGEISQANLVIIDKDENKLPQLILQ